MPHAFHGQEHKVAAWHLRIVCFGLVLTALVAASFTAHFSHGCLHPRHSAVTRRVPDHARNPIADTTTASAA